MRDKFGVEDSASAGILSRPSLSDGLGLHGRFRVECHDRSGLLQWTEERDNLVTTAGKNDALKQWLTGSAYTAVNYLSLIDDAAFSALSASDVLTSHSGWAELTSYSAGTRIAPTWGTAASGSIDNSASPAKFTMTGAATVNGLFMATGSTKGSTGTTGTLLSEVSFGTKRTVASGDIVSVTYTISG